MIHIGASVCIYLSLTSETIRFQINPAWGPIQNVLPAPDAFRMRREDLLTWAAASFGLSSSNSLIKLCEMPSVICKLSLPSYNLGIKCRSLFPGSVALPACLRLCLSHLPMWSSCFRLTLNLGERITFCWFSVACGGISQTSLRNDSSLSRCRISRNIINFVTNCLWQILS